MIRRPVQGHPGGAFVVLGWNCQRYATLPTPARVLAAFEVLRDAVLQTYLNGSQDMRTHSMRKFPIGWIVILAAMVLGALARPAIAQTSPTPRGWLSAASLGNSLYAIGGGTCEGLTCGNFGGNEVATVQAYDAPGNAWSGKTGLTTARFGLSAVQVNGKVYAIGGTAGSGSQPLGIVEEYSPATNTWVGKADMPTPRWKLTAAGVDGIVYAIGGGPSGNQCLPTGVVEAFDVANGAWTGTWMSMPTPRWGAASAVLNGRIWVVGGSKACPQSLVDPSRALEVFNPIINQWGIAAPMRIARWDLAAAAVGGKLYAIGGWDPSGSRVLDTVEEYDLTTNSWTTKSHMPTPRTGLVTVVLNGRIYALGGFDGTRPTNVLEVYDPLTDTWSLPTPVKPLPVVLVHGWCGSPASFGSMAQFLSEDLGVAVLPFAYNGDSSAVSSSVDRAVITRLAAAFADQVHAHMGLAGTNQVDVIAHSMGGLVVRTWMANLARRGDGSRVTYGNEIRRLVMAGTPNLGGDWPSVDQFRTLFAALCDETVLAVASTQEHQMQFGSSFLRTLHEAWEAHSAATITPQDVLLIVGCGGVLTPGCDSDVVVKAASATLPQRTPDYLIRYVNRRHAGHLSMVDIDSRSHETYGLVAEFLISGTALPGFDPEASVPGLIIASLADTKDKTFKTKGVVTFGASGELPRCADLAPVGGFEAFSPFDSSSGWWTLTGIAEGCWVVAAQETVKSRKSYASQAEEAHVSEGRPVIIAPLTMVPQ